MDPFLNFPHFLRMVVPGVILLSICDAMGWHTVSVVTGQESYVFWIWFVSSVKKLKNQAQTKMLTTFGQNPTPVTLQLLWQIFKYQLQWFNLSNWCWPDLGQKSCQIQAKWWFFHQARSLQVMAGNKIGFAISPVVLAMPQLYPWKMFVNAN